MKQNHFTVILDAGHGPKSEHKMFDHGSFKIYEGEVNRQITNKLKKKLDAAGIHWIQVYEEGKDTPLKDRVNQANFRYRGGSTNVYPAYYLSIHSNAGGGNGFEVFTSPGETQSDKIATIFCKHLSKVKDEDDKKFKFRSDHADGDPDKEALFYVLRKTRMPALLVENLFFDNLEEAKYLMSIKGQGRIATALFNSIVEVERTNLARV